MQSQVPLERVRSFDGTASPSFELPLEINSEVLHSPTATSGWHRAPQAGNSVLRRPFGLTDNSAAPIVQSSLEPNTVRAILPTNLLVGGPALPAQNPSATQLHRTHTTVAISRAPTPPSKDASRAPTPPAKSAADELKAEEARKQEYVASLWRIPSPFVPPPGGYSAHVKSHTYATATPIVINHGDTAQVIIPDDGALAMPIPKFHRDVSPWHVAPLIHHRLGRPVLRIDTKFPEVHDFLPRQPGGCASPPPPFRNTGPRYGASRTITHRPQYQLPGHVLPRPSRAIPIRNPNSLPQPSQGPSPPSQAAAEAIPEGMVDPRNRAALPASLASVRRTTTVRILNPKTGAIIQRTNQIRAVPALEIARTQRASASAQSRRSSTRPQTQTTTTRPAVGPVQGPREPSVFPLQPAYRVIAGVLFPNDTRPRQVSPPARELPRAPSRAIPIVDPRSITHPGSPIRRYRTPPPAFVPGSPPPSFEVAIGAEYTNAREVTLAHQRDDACSSSSLTKSMKRLSVDVKEDDPACPQGDVPESSKARNELKREHSESSSPQGGPSKLAKHDREDSRIEYYDVKQTRADIAKLLSLAITPPVSDPHEDRDDTIDLPSPHDSPRNPPSDFENGKSCSVSNSLAIWESRERIFALEKAKQQLQDSLSHTRGVCTDTWSEAERANLRMERNEQKGMWYKAEREIEGLLGVLRHLQGKD